MSEPFQISDRAAAVGNNVMQDLGFIADNDKPTSLIVANFERNQNEVALKSGRRSKKISS